MAFIVKSKYIKAVDPAKSGHRRTIGDILAAKLTGVGVVNYRPRVRRSVGDLYAEVGTVNGFIAGKTTAEVPQ